jgi:hypothetical protein
METYKNDYNKNEDQTLWELHEIRNNLQQQRKFKSIEKINKDAALKYSSWKNEKKRQMYS